MNILVNGKAPVYAIEATGMWSRGEFSTALLGLLAPKTDADFHNKRSTTINNHPAFRYDYRVRQANSTWTIETFVTDSFYFGSRPRPVSWDWHSAPVGYYGAGYYAPGYTGSIWIDKENFRVLRVEMSAVNIPTSLAIDAAESAVDYDYVFIGDKKYLVTTHSEALSCFRGSSECARNVIEFRNYRTFVPAKALAAPP